MVLPVENIALPLIKRPMDAVFPQDPFTTKRPVQKDVAALQVKYLTITAQNPVVRTPVQPERFTVKPRPMCAAPVAIRAPGMQLSAIMVNLPAAMMIARQEHATYKAVVQSADPAAEQILDMVLPLITTQLLAVQTDVLVEHFTVKATAMSAAPVAVQAPVTKSFLFQHALPAVQTDVSGDRVIIKHLLLFVDLAVVRVPVMKLFPIVVSYLAVRHAATNGSDKQFLLSAVCAADQAMPILSAFLI